MSARINIVPFRKYKHFVSLKFELSFFPFSDNDSILFTLFYAKLAKTKQDLSKTLASHGSATVLLNSSKKWTQKRFIYLCKVSNSLANTKQDLSKTLACYGSATVLLNSSKKGTPKCFTYLCKVSK